MKLFFIQLQKMSLKIIKPGLLDTIQDCGRWGYQHLGINVNGPMDSYSAKMANALLGNDLNTPVIEMHSPGATFLFEEAMIICLTGTDCGAKLNTQPLTMHQPVLVAKGSVLECKNGIQGTCSYLSVYKGFKSTHWLGSASTNMKIGEVCGRVLKAGDQIEGIYPFSLQHFPNDTSFLPLHWKAEGLLTQNTPIACLPGPEWGLMTKEAQQHFRTAPFFVSPVSDRMGIRLMGRALEQAILKNKLSSAVTFGSIQLLPDGQLVVLMADHQTTGGYPVIATVISAHLPYLAQCPLKESVQFSMATLEEAELQFYAQQVLLEDLQQACTSRIEKVLHELH
jgi:antagonist of KipI